MAATTLSAILLQKLQLVSSRTVGLRPDTPSTAQEVFISSMSGDVVEVLLAGGLHGVLGRSAVEIL